ncbi:MAG: calcium/proton exchanger [Pirellulaceae bacterium]|nr:MAG: calcium/proton exchanger [Pirellulaceae bacterium]
MDNSRSLNPFSMLIREPLYWLLLALPMACVLRFVAPASLALFIVSCIAIIPLAGLMGRATENLAESVGEGLGGLLNATFGNAAELIIALFFLAAGPQMIPFVKASVTGSIIGNILLVLGLSLLLGGLRFRRQTFNRVAAGMGATLLVLASAGLLVPSFYWNLIPEPAKAAGAVAVISDEIAAILAVVYLLSLVFALKTHRHLFLADHADEEWSHYEPEWSMRTSLVVLALATAGVALMSEFLVGSVEHACESLGMNRVFVGVIVVAVIGNAAEHSTAILVAMKNKMDLSLNIAIGSGLQVALFVAPVLVLASHLMGHQPAMDLHFTWMEVVAVTISVVLLTFVCQDGECHWMEGVLLLALYVILGLAFYHMPAESAIQPGHH